ncbi:ABC transporter substrate-binding protein [Bordetella pseudohinzii]|uniref:ABC transporter substrate-binding protein n=2 Tax=Bordetella pseudohinzii TaxID=1331258 RepID=A0A0J6C7V8_9BORD|nr:ABC transporter substrate-binding protein [Bordetella pseudohinzii]ANY14593.1 ABC transporter substrate-binding protein [Bordetella pseudohinzii]KMM26786.1 ABC transporter substrate-binding protein [Bordetella pseudohinzii]KXA75799.1 ABC transporter substrate-binding protein [Bordetella pseudohinzii]KXA81140.1 ABC transporter substrate-binding protein [Bordetella pseudohinzii]CUI62096.1 Leu/Ile/Val/Thr-binding protein precursor [Bordetella pseudohinzii]
MVRWLAVTALGAALLGPAAASAETVNIGIVLPLSGPNAQFGINAKNGIEQALQDIKPGLGSLDVKLVYADVPAPNAAAAAVQRLVSQNQVVGIVGAFVSSITLAASEVTERTGIPMITHSFADQITSRGYRYIFQVAPKATTFGEKQFQYALDIAAKAGTKLSKIAIFYEDTAYGTSQAEGIRKAAAKAGVDVVIDDGYPLGITDVAPLVNKLRRSDAQVVFPVSYFNDGLLIIRTMRQQRINMPVIGGAAGYIVPDFQKGLGEYAEDVFSIAPANYDAVPDIASRYKAKHGVFMAHEALMYGAALQHMVAAIQQAKSTDPDKIRNAVAALKKCDGFSAGIPGGCTAFDDKGLTSTAYPIFVQWRGADLVTVFPESAAKAPARWMGAEVK